MEKPETIEEFYEAKLDWLLNNLQKEIGHFNVFKLYDFVGPRPKPTPYSWKDFFKISLIFGINKVYYADKIIDIKKQRLKCFWHVKKWVSYLRYPNFGKQSFI